MEAAQLHINCFFPPKLKLTAGEKNMAETEDRSLAKMDLWPGCGVAWRGVIQRKD